MTTQAVASRDERPQPRLVNSHGSNVNKDNWLGFVGDVVNFTGEVCFKSMLRIDGHFSGNVTSEDGTLIVSTGAPKELVLGRTANVKGQVAAPALVVEEGAQLNGSCRRLVN